MCVKSRGKSDLLKVKWRRVLGVLIYKVLAQILQGYLLIKGFSAEISKLSDEFSKTLLTNQIKMVT